MQRRNFIKNTALAVAATSAIPSRVFASSSQKPDHFKLDFAPHEGMFKAHASENLFDQIRFMHQMGFRSYEDNEMRHRPIDEQKAISSLMQGLNMRMGVFVAHKIYWDKPNLASGDKTYRLEFLDDIKNSIEVAKRINAKWMTVVPGHVDLRLDDDYQTANVIESLKQASSLLEPHGIVMVLEPLNFRDHPGLFLSESPQAYQICKAVDSPSCKILFDIYHQQIQEGNLIPNIEATWDEIGYFQIGDNPGRNEPSTGEINYKNVFKHIYDKGYKGILGMEHGNSIDGKKGELSVIEAYKNASNF
ncbi:hydroxypyruvate isomerase family protein [Winogradskyella sp. PG-2]|uniref:hydroxypyruvate isomerase family protein n=1 Tax=Winogradskyella sp. PG-2 TaxID=754409 RepID=UPI0004588C28|nr:TIM barrel protein [Winogradskyella sp. PG-2]BAO76125.1 hydroxypyruvate isomerase [Winogradskyella sp. PG-2]